MSDQSGDELEASTDAPGGSRTVPAAATRAPVVAGPTDAPGGSRTVPAAATRAPVVDGPGGNGAVAAGVARAAVPGASERLHSRVVRVGRALDLLDAAGEAGFVWCSDGCELVGTGEAARVQLGSGRERLGRAADRVAELLGAAQVEDPEGSGLGPVAVAAVPFDDRAPGQLTVPALLLRRGADGATWAVATAAGRAPLLPDLDALGSPSGAGLPWPRITAAHAPLGQQRADWKAAVTAALRTIAGGRLDKVVLARELEVDADRPFRRAAVLRRLRDRAAGAYLYASGAFLGASPELLVARRGGVATSQPMAGTVPSGGTPAAAADRLTWLRTSDKAAAEHGVVVDAVAEILAKVSNDVEVTPAEVVRLPTVAHLATRVTAKLSEPLPSALELAGLLHPTPAVGGVPRDLALAVLAQLEPFARGAYAGPVGWVDAHGDGEWAVAIRCATLTPGGARLVAGAGIVAGSDPEAEWAETEWKLAAVLDVLSGG
jgi:menaquinone-specific isochorismate synthase